MTDTVRQFSPEEMEAQRRALGMSRAALARRSGVSLSTVKRILNAEEPHASLETVALIARALGLDLALSCTASREEILQRQARAKACEIIGLVQGSMALEGQAVQESTLQELIEQTAQDLLAGSRRRLWG